MTKAHSKYTPKHLAILTGLLAMMIAAATGIKSFLQTLIDEATVEEPSACWFLSERVEQILHDDLKMWSEHLTHNPEASMSDWFDLRLPEVVTMHSIMGVTEEEAITCLDSIALKIAKEKLP